YGRWRCPGSVIQCDLLCFFFQAEDGIRDRNVTGVQTCALPISHHMVPPTPGPLAATGILGADLGGVILAGLVFTVILLPVVIVYARWIGPKLEPALNAQV